MGKKKPTRPVDKYFMSIHMGICMGIVDELKALYFGEKEGWTGSETAQTTIPIDKSDLFGGLQKEGGVKGEVHFMVGNETQTTPNGLAARLGLTTATSPGFRGMSSLWFVGAENDSNGFYWSANQPIIQTIWATVRRIPVGLSAGTADINGDANPAHIIYECLTNTDWGMGAPTGNLDVPAFEAAATTLFDEEFGLSLMWAQQSDIESFITEVLDHIQATLFLNPRTGKLTLKLIRNDYTIGTLPEINPDNAKLKSYQRKAWAETINEIVITWTNPTNEQEETVALQDIANVGIQGGVVSENRNYYGVRNKDLAMNICVRDLRSASAPLASVDLELSREAWDFLPGDVVSFSWPEYGITELVIRVLNIDYGRPGEGTIRVKGIEDIFALPFADFTDPPQTEWVDPSEAPSSMDFVHLLTLPAYFLSNVVESGDLAQAEYPEVAAGILAADSGQDTFSYDLLAEVAQPNGGTDFEVIGTRTTVGRGTLPAAYPVEAQTLTPSFPGVVGSVGPAVNGFMVIGSAAEEDTEIAFISDFTAGNFVIERGVLDTVPKDWPISTEVFFITGDTDFFDNSTYSDGDTVEYKLLTRTSLGVLDEGSAPLENETLTGRPYYPLRPTNCQVDGTGFGTATPTGLVPVPTSWSNRNRLTEDSQVLYWGDASVTPESGQTTTIKIYNSGHSLLNTITGLPGDSYDIPLSLFNGEQDVYIEFLSERDVYESLQSFEVYAELVNPPAGFADTKATEHNGIDEVITTPIDLSGKTAFTIATWAKRDLAGDHMEIAQCNGLDDARVKLQWNADGNLYGIVGGSGQVWVRSAETSTGWHFIAMTYDGTELTDQTKLKTFFDGAEEVTNDGTATIPSVVPTISNNLKIGLDDGTSTYSDGRFGETTVWDRALTPAEITELYNGGSAMDVSAHSQYADCLMWLRHGDGSGDTPPTIDDQTSNNNDGTLVNMDITNIVTDAP